MKYLTKNLTFFATLALVLILFSMTTTAFATDGEMSGQALFEQWERYGYPDDIGGIYFDNELGMYGILLVNPTPAREEEIRAMLSEDVIITPSLYSMNELRLAQREITTIMGLESGIFGLGVGWTSTNNQVHGFGESEREFRLVVDVDESVFEHYTAGFAELYGDRVVVKISQGIGIVDTPESAYADIQINPIPLDISVALSGSAFWGLDDLPGTTRNVHNYGFMLWVIVGVGLLVALLIFFRLRLRPAMQTTNGEIIADNSAISKKYVIEAVKNSAITPSDGIFNSIMEKIDKANN
jgi:hypothetical protein